MKKYKINKGFITQKVGNKTTIFAGEESILYTLNDTASFIFQGLKLGWEKSKIVRGLIDKYETTKNEATKDMENLIRDLQKKKILV